MRPKLTALRSATVTAEKLCLTGKRNAVGNKSGSTVANSVPVLRRPTSPPTAGRKPAASPPSTSGVGVDVDLDLAVDLDLDVALDFEASRSSQLKSWGVVLDLLGEHDVAVAIIASKSCCAVGTYGELPDLKFLGGNGLVVGLNDRDLVQKPICSTVLGNVLCAVGIENVAVDSVPIPVFAAGELREVAFTESLRRHVVPLSF